jgi:hypothetical protein
MISLHPTRTRVLVVLVSLFIMLMAGVWVFRLDRQGQANLRSCREIQPGGGRADLVQTLGSPIASELNPARTRLVLFFGGPVFGSRSIRAVVNVRDDVVMEIDCGNGQIRTYDKY